MPRLTLKLVALGAIFTVAPVLAANAAATGPSRPCCPKKHAQAAAAAAAAARAQQPKGGTTITLSDRVPDGSLLDLGWRHGILMP